MRYFIIFLIWLLPHAMAAQDWEDRQVFGPVAKGQSGSETLRILSSTDTALFAPIIENFLTGNPAVTVEYLVSGTADIDRVFRASPNEFDVLISSAMDLQIRAVNDGYAQQLTTIVQPAWAQWRQSLFAFTSEPAAIVINRTAFTGRPAPRTRQDLIEAIRARPEVFRGRIGTYDIRQSGVGYLFATQDARASETYWRLMEVMGGLDVRLYCCSGEMIDDLADGTIAVAYNVLASYANARTESRSVIETILPSDFPTTMMRTALVSANAPNPSGAERFVRHLTSLPSAPSHTGFALPLLDANLAGVDRATIALEPALMTFLDGLKRRRFLAEWEAAVIQD